MFSMCCSCQPPKSNFSFIEGLNDIQIPSQSNARCTCGGQFGGSRGAHGSCAFGGPGGCNSCGGSSVINSKLACEIPWLKPMPIACDEAEEEELYWSFALDYEELDDGELPGRPNFRVQCVKVCGDTKLSLRDCDDSDPYSLCVCARVPVEVVITDACNFTYCLHSYYTQMVTIPLCRKAELLGEDISAYVKVCLRLVSSEPIEAGSLEEPGDNDDCSYDIPDTDYWLPPVILASTISVCLTKMVPYGVVCS